MAEIIISSYFENNSGPVVGLTPTVRIWEVTDSGQDLVVGSPCGSGQNTDGTMIEIQDCGSPSTQDGFYRFTFTDTIGYDVTKTYVVRVDGGGSLTSRDRYQVREITPLDAVSIDGVVDQTWNEQTSGHLTAGSTGLALAQTKADTTNLVNALYADMDSVLNMLEVLLKHELGRTKIDPVAKTLTVYDEDCTTILRVYDLYDSTDTKSITDVCQRVPRTKGSGDITTITDVCPGAIP